MWPLWCAPLLHHDFSQVASKTLNLLLVFNSKTSNQGCPLSSPEFLLPNCWISCNIAVNVFLVQKSFRPVTLTLILPLPPLIPHLSEVLQPSLPLSIFQFFLQAVVSVRPSTFEMGCWPCSCQFLRHLFLHLLPSRSYILDIHEWDGQVVLSPCPLALSIPSQIRATPMTFFPHHKNWA